MKTELEGAFRSGFKLTEKDVRRIVDIVIDKMKSLPDQTVTRKINYKLANGAIIDTDNLDDVFAEENIGTKKDYLFRGSNNCVVGRSEYGHAYRY